MAASKPRPELVLKDDSRKQMVQALESRWSELQTRGVNLALEQDALIVVEAVYREMLVALQPNSLSGQEARTTVTKKALDKVTFQEWDYKLDTNLQFQGNDKMAVVKALKKFRKILLATSEELTKKLEEQLQSKTKQTHVDIEPQ
eukprot:TRINITY_DN93658_c0_g1_i1.p1 TRINITY_DN93658_c0_g1~~TRINITY_DN93658_c0_g1_i1.p1  ORF type:complete len:158 (-),score=29.59 TRINITY_DN93658_c0_g1_i1:496-930(-)